MQKVLHSLEVLHHKMQAINSRIERIEQKLDIGPSAGKQSPPPTVPSTSVYVHGSDVVDVDSRRLNVDEVLFGYDLIFESHRLFLGSSWLGVQSMQNPADAWSLQQLQWRIKPKVVVDIGTNVGGSAVLFADIMSHYLEPGQGVIVSCDPKHVSVNAEPQGAAAKCPDCTSGDKSPLWKWVDYHQAKSMDDAAIKAVEAAVKKHGGPVLVSVDGDHDGPTVLEELRAYAKFVTPGSYMVVQDTKLDRLWSFRQYKGPLWAIRQFLAEPAGAQWEVDRDRELFWYSQHAHGYLKKKG